MVKDEIVAYIESYAQSFQPPIYEGVTVTRLHRNDSDAFEVTSDMGIFTADQVIVATGGYQDATIPRMAEGFRRRSTRSIPPTIKMPSYFPPADGGWFGSIGLPDRRGSASARPAGPPLRRWCPGTARRYRGKDVVDWLNEMGYYDKPIHEHPQKERVRAKANHYVTGRDGGRISICASSPRRVCVYTAG